MLFIDNINIREQYGIHLNENSYKGLVNWYALKEPVSNNWYEYNGIEVDLTEPKLASKQFDFQFSGTDNAKTRAFFDFIISKQLHRFRMPLFGDFEFILRYLSMPNNSTLRSLSLFSLKFIDAYPLRLCQYFDNANLPTTDMQAKIKIKIDGKDLLEHYGVYVLQGIASELTKLPKAKQGLSLKSKFDNGSFYFDNGQSFNIDKSEINIKCFIRQPINIWANYYYGLLKDLIKPNERILEEEFFYKSYKCYYKSSIVEDFGIINNRIVVLKFTIKLILIDYLN